jgi:hypothetical protein
LAGDKNFKRRGRWKVPYPVVGSPPRKSDSAWPGCWPGRAAAFAEIVVVNGAISRRLWSDHWSKD